MGSIRDRGSLGVRPVLCGRNDRELAMAVAQKQMEQLRNVNFTDTTLNATGPVNATLTRAGRSYR